MRLRSVACWLIAVMAVHSSLTSAQVNPCTGNGHLPWPQWACSLPGAPVAAQPFQFRVRQLLGAHCGVVVRTWWQQQGNTIDFYLGHANGCFGIPPTALTIDTPVLTLPAGDYQFRVHNRMEQTYNAPFDPASFALARSADFSISGTVPAAALAAPGPDRAALLLLALAVIAVAWRRLFAQH